jgi:hypothetical protein
VIVNPTSGNPAVAGITNGSGSAVSGSQTGTGSAGTFTITNFANNNPAIAGITDGTGPVISASQIGTGKAGTFTINNPANISPALTSTTNGAGAAISGTQTGSGSAGSFNVTSPLSTSSGITVTQDGIGAGVSVQLTKSNNNKHGIDVNNAGIGAGVFAQSLGGNGVWGMTKAVSAAAVLGDNTIGEAVVGRVLGDNVNFPDRDGNGIGAVVGRNDLKNGYGIRGFTFGSGGIGVLGQSGISGGVNIAARFENLNGANPSDVLQVRSTGTAALATFQVNNANVARIDSTGRGFFNGGTQTGGADVAEVIPSTGPQPGPGDVVEIDPEHPLHYRLSSSAGSTMVAGVITTLPGVLMNKMADDETSAPALALVGRVPVKIVGEGGPVRPGDLLVASSTPGHAMRAPAEVKPGTVIGKALEPFTGETGTIQMLVMTR